MEFDHDHEDEFALGLPGDEVIRIEAEYRAGVKRAIMTRTLATELTRRDIAASDDAVRTHSLLADRIIYEADVNRLEL